MCNIIIIQIQQNLEVAQQQEMQYKQQLEASYFLLSYLDIYLDIYF